MGTSVRSRASIGLAVLTLAAGCPATRPVGQIRPDSLHLDVGQHQSRPVAGMQDVTFAVRWPQPDRFVQSIPDTTRAVTFFVTQEDRLVNKATVVRSEGPSASKTIQLLPGDYKVEARAYGSFNPTDDTPVLAVGAATFTVIEGRDSDVSVTLLAAGTPAPMPPPGGSPTPLGATPSPSAGGGTPVSSPSPSATPKQPAATVSSVDSNFGVPGDTVTITGTNLSWNGAAVTVYFYPGVDSPQVSVKSSTVLTAVIPDGAFTGPVSVQVGNTLPVGGPNFWVLDGLALEVLSGGVSTGAAKQAVAYGRTIQFRTYGTWRFDTGQSSSTWGPPIPVVPASFSVASPAAGSITSSGLFTASATDSSTNVTALFESVTGNAYSVSVQAPPLGIVTTYSGSSDGPRYITDGSLLNARYVRPVAISGDGGGSFYVADQGVSSSGYSENWVRKISKLGVVTTIPPDGTEVPIPSGSSTPFKFLYMSGVAADSEGSVFVALYRSYGPDYFLAKIDTADQISTVAGGLAGYADGAGSASRFRTLGGIALDLAGNLFAADAGNGLIRKISRYGIVTSLPGLADGHGLAIDQSGNILIAGGTKETSGTQVHEIAKVPPSGGALSVVAGGSTRGYKDGPAAAAQFNYPNGVAVGVNGNVFVADTGNHAIRRISPDGTVTTLAGAATSTGCNDGYGSAAKFKAPNAIVVDQQGNLLVSDADCATIKLIQ